MKMVHIVGNRPQFIKLALLYPELQHRNPGQGRIIHTGQHFDPEMSGIFFDQLGIPAPDHQLTIRNLSHNEMIGNMLIEIDRVLATEKPDQVVVYGDTNTTLAGALAAKKRNIPLAHIESGIRTGKEDMPEESNRYLTDRMADWNFACTHAGVKNLVREGFRVAGTPGSEGPVSPGGERPGKHIPGGVYNCGDLMLDAALLFRGLALSRSSVLQGLGMKGQPFILATIHRAENTDDGSALRNILEALNSLHTQIPVIFPMHPRTRQIVGELNIPTGFILTGPLGYLDMLALLQSCESVVTDSGGLSREAFFFHKPTLVVMQNPFWPEIFEHGHCLHAEAVKEDILEKFRLLQSPGKPFEREVFGDGRAAAKIAEILAGEVPRNV
jgi:UDP-GlcNAc3NAcA epimerase